VGGEHRLWRGALVVAALAVSRGELTAQVKREAQVAVVVTTAAPRTVAAGPGMAVRIGRRDRLVGWAGLGTADGGFAARGEALYHFLLSPEATKAGFYLGGGLAGAYAEEWRGRLVGVAGVEGSPGGRQGWFVEAGFGGGVRVAVGFRWRRP
jgi:hypothetical protein